MPLVKTLRKDPGSRASAWEWGAWGRVVSAKARGRSGRVAGGLAKTSRARSAVAVASGMTGLSSSPLCCHLSGWGEVRVWREWGSGAVSGRSQARPANSQSRSISFCGSETRRS